MKHLIFLSLILTFIYADNKNRTFDCTKIFEQRKSELLYQLDKIDEQNQALESLRDATSQLLDKKKTLVDAKEAKVTQMLADINATKQSIAKLKRENEAILKAIKEQKGTKVTNIYAKMKPAAAALIFEKLPTKEASDILGTLKPKTLSKLLAKMPPEVAAKLTTQMGKIPKK